MEIENRKRVRSVELWTSVLLYRLCRSQSYMRHKFLINIRNFESEASADQFYIVVNFSTIRLTALRKFSFTLRHLVLKVYKL